MSPYRIVAVATTAQKMEAIIHGPGIEPGGLRREFQSEQEAKNFVDTMNLAFEQGFQKGMHAPRGTSAGSPF